MRILLNENKDIKNVDEYINNFLDENDLTEYDIFYRTSENEKKLLKSKTDSVVIVLKRDIIVFVKEFINNISSALKVEIKAEINFKDNILNIIITSNNNALLIGHDGKNLKSIESLIRQSIINQTGINVKVNLDISNYKAKKVKNLEFQAKKLAYEVIKTRVEVKLDPMNSYERRIVHNIVNKFDELETESTGEEPNRYVVIRIKDKD